MKKRRVTKPVYVGDVKVGGDAQITVQTMTKTDTRDVAATVDEITSTSSPATSSCVTRTACRRRR